MRRTTRDMSLRLCSLAAHLMSLILLFRHVVLDLLTTATAGGTTVKSARLTDTVYAVSSPVAATVAKRLGSAWETCKGGGIGKGGQVPGAAPAQSLFGTHAARTLHLNTAGSPTPSTQVGAWSAARAAASEGRALSR